MPDASPIALSTHTCRVAKLLKVVTAQILDNLMKNCFDKLLRRGRDDVQTLGSLGALDRLDIWNIDDFPDSLQLRDLDCLLHDLHLRNMHDLDDWPVHQGRRGRTCS